MDEQEKLIRDGIAQRLMHNVMPLFIANMLGAGLTEAQAWAVINLLMDAFAEDKEIMDEQYANKNH